MEEVFRLVMEGPPEDGRVWIVRAKGAMGRDRGCLVRVEARGVSRQHTELEPAGDGLRVKDLQSRNGTRLDGVRVTDGVAKVGSRIQVGEAIVRVERAPGGEWVGRRIGGYELVEVVGEGGMGTVFRARQLSLDRTVALKILNDRLRADPKYIERFLSEARLAAQLNHPNIIQVHDFGATQGIYFFSMEFVEGKTLLERMRQEEPIDLREVLRIMQDTAGALEYAHGHSLIHRDVKPENVMLSRDGEVKLADLGIAKDLRQVGAESPTGQRVVLGTPLYMAPESALGEAPDPRVDLYSLGATMYHVLAGRPPHVGRTSTEIIRKHVGEPHVPLATSAPGIHPSLCELVDQMLQKDPRLRPADAGEVRRRAGALLAGLDRRRAHPVRRPGRSRAARGALTLVLLAAGAWGGVHLGNRLREKWGGTWVPPPTSDPSAAPLARARESFARGAFAETLVACDEAVRAAGSPEAVAAARDLAQQARRGETMRREEAARGAWEALRPALSGGDPAEALARVEAFLAAHAGTAIEGVAAAERDRLGEEVRRRDEALDATARERARRLTLLTAQVEAGVAQGQLGGIAERLEETRPLFAGTDAEAAWSDLVARTAAARRTIVEEAASRIRARTGISLFSQALAAHAEAAARLGEEEPPELAEALEQLDTAASARAREAVTRVDALLAVLDIEGALREARAAHPGLDGTPWGEGLTLRLRRAEHLERLRTQVVDRIGASPPARQYEMALPGRGVFRVVGADAQGIRAGAEPVVAIPWTDLPAVERHRLFLHYLDERQSDTQALLYAHAEAYGLPEMAADARARPGMEEELRRRGLLAGASGE